MVCIQRGQILFRPIRRWVRVDYFARDCKTTVRRVQLLRRCVVKQCIFLGLFSVVASELTSTVICAEGSVVGTMCLETMIPCACKLTMRPVVQLCRERRWVRVADFARDCKTTRRETCKEGAELRRCVVKQCSSPGLVLSCSVRINVYSDMCRGING